MNIACVIPYYNNPDTILDVAEKCRRYLQEVIVVDDGSTQHHQQFETTLQQLGITLLKHQENQGKGAALITAFNYLQHSDCDYAITIDADGQHKPEDLQAFIEAINEHAPDCDKIFIGVRDFTVPNVPGSSKFGRSFSNFWVALETGVLCRDTQSGFRAYPVKPLEKLRFSCRRYNFEIEILVKCLRGGIQLHELPIDVIYPPTDERISHFAPFKDNFRLSLLHTKLVCQKLLPIPAKRLVPKRPSNIPKFWRHPKAFIKYIFSENATPEMLGISAAVSSFLAVFPIYGFSMLIILYVSIRLKLNKPMALAIQNLFMPPLSPFACILLGHFLRTGELLKPETFRFFSEFRHRVFDWFCGSLVLAPLAAIIVGSIVMLIARKYQASKRSA